MNIKKTLTAATITGYGRLPSKQSRNNESQFHAKAVPLGFALKTYVVPLLLAFSALTSLRAVAAAEPAHEVWMTDQSNTYDSDGNGTLDSGGTLYIFDGSKLAGTSISQANPEVIPLGGAVADWVKRVTGAAPVRPHNITFNSSHTHAIVSFVASGHVLIFDAATRTAVFAVDVGAQAHAAVPSPDETYILVANQNGKLLQRINTDYVHNAFALDEAATLNLATGTTPSGALKQDDALTQVNVRPDTAPIFAQPDATSGLAFVTLRGGGMFVVNPRATPMAIVNEYTIATIKPSGLMAVQRGDKLYLNSGGGGAGPLAFQSILYRLPVSAFSASPNPIPDSPAPAVLFDYSNREVKDAHGLLLTGNERYLWVADRAANLVIVVDTQTDTVANEINLVGVVSNDPAPDLFALSPSGNFAYVTLRGSIPLSGNNTNVNNAKGFTPSLGVIQVEQTGMTGILQARFAISNLDGAGVQRADPHGVAVRSIPLITTIRVSQVEVCWNSTSNLTYQVQYRSGLTTNLWTSLVDCVRSTDSKSCISDPVVVGQPQRFYRVIQTNCVPAL